MKLDLVNIIVQSCCPCIPIHPTKATRALPELPPVTSYSQRKPVITSQSLKKILNDGEDWKEPVRHPVAVARELLEGFIMLMKSKYNISFTLLLCVIDDAYCLAFPSNRTILYGINRNY